jgi:hypothetical protein
MQGESAGLYDAGWDAQFQKPYVDIDEWREGEVRYHYVHGGFDGSEARFSFFFPDKDHYKGRFFQFMAPVQGNEDASIGRKGEEDKITFAITHGAYFVETNMGVAVPFAPIADPTVLYRSSAAAAEYSRQIASKLYGAHRPFGYIYGGSGGGFKAMSCFENTGAWDGAVPYVIGTPMSIPNCFTVRGHARRILRDKLHLIADAMEPGGSGDPYTGLNREGREALEEITRMGFPLRSWFLYKTLDDGSLPVLLSGVIGIDKNYYQDFWTVPGYLGADLGGSAVRDRIQHETKILQTSVPQVSTVKKMDGNQTGVDDAWQRLRDDNSARSWVRLESLPVNLSFLRGVSIAFLSGDAVGCKVPLEALDGDRAIIGAGFGENVIEILSRIKPGDKVILDNSDYIAIQTYHRHQVPDASYTVWDQFRDEKGVPLYPQRPSLTGPIMAVGGSGSLQSGVFKGKMIVVSALMDESAFPWQADWYRNKVKEALGSSEKENFRLWYMDNALHDDSEKTVDELHVVSYLGALHQALLDVSAWVEQGLVPPAGTVYTINDGQISVPPDAASRKGIQPVVTLRVNGGECTKVSVGETVRFSGKATVPPGTGKLTTAEWSFEGEADYPVKGEFSDMNGDNNNATIEAVHAFTKPGIYFSVLRVKSQREGKPDNIFTQVKNLCRVRVVVQ